MLLGCIRLNLVQKVSLFLTAVSAGLVGFAIATRPENGGLGDASAIGLMLSSVGFGVAGMFNAPATPCPARASSAPR